MLTRELAQWIIDNEEMKGTPEFEKVAALYKAFREKEPMPADMIKMKPWEEAAARGRDLLSLEQTTCWETYLSSGCAAKRIDGPLSALLI